MIYFSKFHGSYYGLHYNPTLSNSATRLADFATIKPKPYDYIISYTFRRLSGPLINYLPLFQLCPAFLGNILDILT